MRRLVEALDFHRWLPAQEILAHAENCGADCVDSHRQAARDRDGEFAIVYLTDGGTERVDLSPLTSGRLHAAWFDPRTGHVEADMVELQRRVGPQDFIGPSSGEGCDWVLVLSSSADRIRGLEHPGNGADRSRSSRCR